MARADATDSAIGLAPQDVLTSQHCRLDYWSVDMWWRDDGDGVNRRSVDHLVVIRERLRDLRVQRLLPRRAGGVHSRRWR